MRKRKFSPAVDRLEGRQLLAAFTVTNLADSGSGSLRGAVQASDVTPGPNTINFAPGLTGTIQLTSGEIAIHDNAVTINGPGAGAVAVDGRGLSRIFNIYNVNATINNLALENGHDVTGGGGGAVAVNGASLTTLNADTFINNSARIGGAVVDINGSAVVVNGSTFLNNTSVSSGGAIFNASLLTVNGSTFVGGHAGPVDWGGAIMSAGNAMTLNNDQFLSNSAAGGGAVGLGAGDATVTGSLFLSNSANAGGAIIAAGTGTLTVSNSTIEANQGILGGALYLDVNTVLNNDTVTFNHASWAGGGVWAKAGKLTQVGGNIRFNTPTDVEFFT